MSDVCLSVFGFGGIYKVTTQLPPIYRDYRRLLVYIEAVVRRFSHHKYTVGTDLHQQAMGLMRGVYVAVLDKPNQARHVQALVWQVETDRNGKPASNSSPCCAPIFKT